MRVAAKDAWSQLGKWSSSTKVIISPPPLPTRPRPSIKVAVVKESTPQKTESLISVSSKTNETIASEKTPEIKSTPGFWQEMKLGHLIPQQVMFQIGINNLDFNQSGRVNATSDGYYRMLDMEVALFGNLVHDWFLESSIWRASAVLPSGQKLELSTYKISSGKFISLSSSSKLAIGGGPLFASRTAFKPSGSSTATTPFSTLAFHIRGQLLYTMAASWKTVTAIEAAGFQDFTHVSLDQKAIWQKTRYSFFIGGLYSNESSKYEGDYLQISELRLYTGIGMDLNLR